MTKENIIRLRRIYKIILSISIIVAGICFIVGCLSIYYSGNGYSRDIVAKTFSKINILVYICFALIIGDIIWESISPSTAKVKVFKKKNDNTPNAPIEKKLKITRLVILVVAIVALILGAVFGGYSDVLTKAVNICTECIGLG